MRNKDNKLTRRQVKTPNPHCKNKHLPEKTVR